MKPIVPSSRTARVFFCFLLLFPLIVFIVSVRPEKADEWRTALHVFDGYAFQRLANSAALAALGSLLAVLFALPIYGLFLTRSSWGRRLLTVFSLLPIAYPAFGVASVWMTLVTAWEQTGSGRLIWEVDGLASRLLFSLVGGGWVLGLCYWPIVFILLTFSAEPTKAQYDSALLTMKPWALFRNVLWPAWRLPLTLAISIVFCLGLLQFEVPSLLQIDVYPLEIYIRFTAFLNEWSALILSLPYVAVAVFLCWALSRITPHISMNGSEFTIQPYTQSVRVLLSVGVCAVFLLSCFVPLFGSFIHIGSIGLFLRTFAEHWENILRSVFYCAAGSFCIIGLGFWYTAVETNRDRWFAPSVFLSLFVLPGILIASAWLRVRSFWPGVLPGGVALLSLLGGYITHYFILGYGAGLMLWRYYGERQKEFDSLLKLGMFYRIRRLIVPILWRPGLRATALIALLLWGDAGMTVLLHPPGKESLSVEYFNLLHYGTEARTAAIGSIMMLMPASILLLIFLGTGWKSRQS